MVTGARVKIGYRIALKFFRAGVNVIVMMCFFVDVLKCFEGEDDVG